jgi:hypothetical protein
MPMMPSLRRCARLSPLSLNRHLTEKRIALDHGMNVAVRIVPSRIALQQEVLSVSWNRTGFGNDMVIITGQGQICIRIRPVLRQRCNEMLVENSILH